MSKKLYLLCALLVVVLALTVVPALAATQVVKTFNMNTNPGWTLEGDWAFGLPQGLGGDPDTHAGRDPNSTESAGNVLGENLAGNYTATVDESAISGDIDLSGKVGVKLTFKSWLEVQDSLHDQATVEVSNDGGGSWTEVFKNSPDADTKDATTTVGGVSREVDISSVADHQTIQIRFRMVSDSTIEFGGWNLKTVTISAEADASGSAWLMGATDDLTTAWTLDAGWQVGAPAAGTSGQPPSPDPDAQGVDPSTDSTGVVGSVNPILGYRIGANYERSMVQKYATSPVQDFTSARSVKLLFQRWLAVEDGRFDHAALQINNDGLDDSSEALNEDFSGGLGSWAGDGTGTVDVVDEALALSGNESATLTVDTSQFYTMTINAELGFTPATGSTGSVKLQFNGGSGWVTIATVPAVQSLTAIPPFTVPAPSAAENNASFKIRVLLSGLATDAAAADNIVITGVKWVDLFTNPVGPNGDGTKADFFDTEWAAETIDLTDFADGNDAVSIRFVMGPSDGFVPTPPQLGTEFGGWSVENIQFTTGTSQWLPTADELPTGMVWETGDTATFTVKNYGTGYWDDLFTLDLVEAALITAPVADRWSANETAVDGTVASSDSTDFSFDIVAPPLTSLVYKVPLVTGAPDPSDPKKSNLDINATLLQDGVPVPLYDDLSGTGVPTGKIVTDRFPDILPGSDGNWARYWTEELAGRVPFVIRGFTEPDGSATYRPLVQIDRSAMSVFIQRAMMIDISNAAFKGTFRDVDEDTFGALSIEALAAASVVQGFPPDFTTFQPATLVSRDQMAKFIANGAGLATPTPGTATFDDVPLLIPGTTNPNPFAKFIYACATANIVQGFKDITIPNNVTYRPLEIVGRDQLAVFVWRAFMRVSGTAVVLGGPAVTAIDPSAAATVGWQSVGEANAWADTNFMYVTLDALRLNTNLLTPSGASQVFQVRFELRGPSDVTAPVSRTFITDTPVGGPELTAAGIATVKAAAAASGVPYLTFFKLIPKDSPTAPATTPFHGDFTLVVSVATPSGAGLAWNEVLRQPEYKAYGRRYFDNFDAGIPGAWTLTGDPAKPVAVGVAGIGKAGQLNGQVAKFVKTGQMKQSLNMTGWSDMILTAKIIPAFLGASDTFTIQYSTDGGVTWTTGYSKTNVPKPSNLAKVSATKISFALGSAANDNPNFQLRITLNGAAVSAIVYLDDLQIKGL